MNQISPRLQFLFPIVLIFAVYFPILNFNFAYDDTFRIKEEALVSSNLSLFEAASNIFSQATYPGDLYRPLTTLAYKIQFILFGLNPGLFHIVNLLLHTFCCVLAFALLRQYKVRASVLCISIFAIHPINVEAVASIAGQAELLSTFFGLLGLFVFEQKIAAIPRTFLVCLCFGAAAFSKESGLVFSLLALCIAVLRSQKSLPIVIAGLASGISYLTSRALVLGSKFLVDRPDVFLSENPLLDKNISFVERIIPALESLGDYLRLLAMPIQLSTDYSRGYDIFWQRVYSFDGFFSLLLTIGFAFIGFRSKDILVKLGIVWFFVSFVSTCNLLVPIGVIFAERLAYLPSLGFILSAVLILKPVVSSRIATGIAFLLVGLLAMRSSFLVPIWQNDRVLFKALGEQAPNSPKAQYIAGKEYLVVDKNFERAEFHLRKSLELDPQRFGPMRELGNLYLQKNDYQRAAFWISKALEVKPEDAELRGILDKMYSRSG